MISHHLQMFLFSCALKTVSLVLPCPRLQSFRCRPPSASRRPSTASCPSRRGSSTSSASCPEKKSPSRFRPASLFCHKNKMIWVKSVFGLEDGVSLSPGDGQRLHPVSRTPGLRKRRRQHHPGSCHADGHRSAAAGGAHAQEGWVGGGTKSWRAAEKTETLPKRQH